jgi:prophage regulatory protein
VPAVSQSTRVRQKARWFYIYLEIFMSDDDTIHAADPLPSRTPPKTGATTQNLTPHVGATDVPTEMEGMLCASKVLAITALGRTTLYKLIGMGLFPESRPIGGRRVAWVARHIREIIHARSWEWSEQEIKELVRKQNAERKSQTKTKRGRRPGGRQRN